MNIGVRFKKIESRAEELHLLLMEALTTAEDKIRKLEKRIKALEDQAP